MDRAQIINQIRKNAAQIRAHGATGLCLYGSRARGDEHAGSDLDIFVDFEPGSGFSLMEMAGIKDLIEAQTGLDVHITTRGSLHPRLQAKIEAQSIRVF